MSCQIPVTGKIKGRLKQRGTTRCFEKTHRDKSLDVEENNREYKSRPKKAMDSSSYSSSGDEEEDEVS